MKKDETIIQLIKKLDVIIKYNSIEIVDYWDADLCAIGLKKENRLVYISTYNYLNNKTIKYDIDLELADSKNLEKRNSVIGIEQFPKIN